MGEDMRICSKCNSPAPLWAFDDEYSDECFLCRPMTDEENKILEDHFNNTGLLLSAQDWHQKCVDAKHLGDNHASS